MQKSVVFVKYCPLFSRSIWKIVFFVLTSTCLSDIIICNHTRF
jgi:hypothetical protein